MQALLDACKRGSSSDASYTWASETLLVSQGVTPWTELPLWMLEQDNAFLETANSKAIAAGLTFRPIEQTVKDTLAWDRTRSSCDLHAGLAPEREADAETAEDLLSEFGHEDES